jgi:hypothetical protein
MVKKTSLFIFTGMDFGLNPNQATIFPKKKRNHCLRNHYDIKICNYIIIVKKQGEGIPFFF